MIVNIHIASGKRDKCHVEKLKNLVALKKFTKLMALKI